MKSRVIEVVEIVDGKERVFARKLLKENEPPVIEFELEVKRGQKVDAKLQFKE